MLVLIDEPHVSARIQTGPDRSRGGLKKILFLLLLILAIGFVAVTSRTRSDPPVPEASVGR